MVGVITVYPLFTDGVGMEQVRVAAHSGETSFPILKPVYLI
jgi:hypothetical protein